MFVQAVQLVAARAHIQDGTTQGRISRRKTDQQIHAACKE